MELLLIAVLIIVVVFVFMAKAKSTQSGSTDKKSYPFNLKGNLLTPAERSFYGVLLQAVPQGVSVFSKVRLSDVMSVRKGTEKPMGFLSQLSQKHFDFLLCATDTTKVLLAVELDDASHKNKRAAARDEFKDSAALAAGLPLVRVKASDAYVMADIRQQLVEAINPPKPETEAISHPAS